MQRHVDGDSCKGTFDVFESWIGLFDLPLNIAYQILTEGYFLFSGRLLINTGGMIFADYDISFLFFIRIVQPQTRPSSTAGVSTLPSPVWECFFISAS
jgi:hypothetical protein